MLLCNLAASGGTKGGHGPRRRPKRDPAPKGKIEKISYFKQKKESRRQ